MLDNCGYFYRQTDATASTAKCQPLISFLNLYHVRCGIGYGMESYILAGVHGVGVRGRGDWAQAITPTGTGARRIFSMGGQIRGL